MNPFKSYVFTWWQLGLLKTSMLALGLALGATWPGAFARWRAILWVVFLIPAIYLMVISFQQM
ncbi:MAG: hypothetical protein A2W66_08360 [Deltaproteobacteria bacterium RIFCSPLOWO2_02_56_12]|nr:MAG: hypothetical protein A2W66_08360 [Deltaproteobacteria bacterium RIFCSPLOWO2_02_56_12]